MKIPAPILAPLAITEEGLTQLAEVVRDAGPRGLSKKDAEPLKDTRLAEHRDGIAIVPIEGPLFKKPNLFSFLFGASSYETILKDLTAALEDESIHTVVLDIDSPGGEAFGCGELSSAIYEARGKKEIVSYVSGMCCSAAYWIGSAADRMVIDPSSMVGSIGVRQMLVDDSKRDEMQGVKEHQIVSSQSPYKVVDASNAGDRGRVQDTMTAMASVFIANVARNRGVSETKVSKDFGRGDVFVGKQAIDAGMADELGDFEALLSELQSNAPKGLHVMAKKTGAPEASMKASKCDGCERDMDDDDDTYCRACHSDVDSKALFAAIGAKTLAEAAGLVTGWKAQQGENERLRGELATLQAEKSKAQITALLDEAGRDGRLPPAQRAVFESLAEKHGLDALKASLSVTKPVVSPVSRSVAVSPEPHTANLVVGLTDEEKRIADKFGQKHEAVLKNKVRLLAAAKKPVVVVDDEEDAAQAAGE